nr:hypothetical protein [uncultured Pantoea sp.]
MLTKEMIDDDVDKIREMLRGQGFVIPGLWMIVWPVVLFFAFIVFVQIYICSHYVFDDDFHGNRYFDVLFTGMMALIASLGAMNARARYFCIPKEIRKSSVIIRFIVKKTILYTLIWVGIYLCTGAYVLNSPKAALSTVSLSFFISGLLLMFIFNIDMARFELSALNKIYELWKENKL